ncbi:MAG: peptide chain release factor N(5)-glutamine methyltransferase [Lachnospiraceae bacterium]|nr:peptide chain release factor N(5)-glutamine methyltransferase [Lachnospiraceae bacterium]
MTYFDAVKYGIEKLEEAQVPNARFDAEELLLFVADFSKSDYLLHKIDEIKEEELLSYKEVIEKRCKRIPLQHIIGVQDFMGLMFEVNEDVLCPRLDTESVVEKAYDLIDAYESPKILDLCTGSGCIAVSMYHHVKKQKKKVAVYAVDASEKALNVAKKNALNNRAYIEFFLGDLFEPVSDESFDMIISNPPYIPSLVVDGLMPEVRDHEPRMALDGDEDGLKFYRLISKEGKHHLHEGGVLIFEIGFNQGKDVETIMKNDGYLDVTIQKDLAGNDRIAFGHL